ncbi:TetR/AcrR family transcriptional regulator [Frankia sp. QA3]|uniref:TetR/AcrR family transcriptional regulator n=1 Tax=Frankia sp. QA3 TaxID=710111 RepID=UPI0002F452F0|nr:TetR/AcrR family transcriptional regulator [Frankia sp. QA3]
MTGDGQRMRADARRNRDRIVEAARELFTQHGLSVSTNEVARHAGVGIATLLRRFPTRDELVGAAFFPKMTGYRDAMSAALADPDPWHGFCRFIETVCGMQVADLGFTEVLTRTFPTARALESQRDEVAADFGRLIGRAQAAGRLRADFAHQDLVVILMANAGVVASSGPAAEVASRRLVGYLLRSFAVDAAHAADAADADADAAAAHAELPPPPSRTAMYRAMLRLRTAPPEPDSSP